MNSEGREQKKEGNTTNENEKNILNNIGEQDNNDKSDLMKKKTRRA